MKPPRDNNNDDELNRWDLSSWDLHTMDDADDPDEWQDSEDPVDPYLELVEGYGDELEIRRPPWLSRAIRFTALVALVVFCTVFVLPSALSGIRIALKNPGTPDYYSRIVTSGSPLRFERQQIRYSIVIPPNYPPDSLDVLERPLSRAMGSWSDPLGDRINFVPAPAAGADDLLVHFVTDLPTAGMATIRPGPRYRPEIFIRIDVHGPMPSSAMLETIACHELGHVLGIWGHSDYEGDCMYPIATRRAPSARDIRTIRMIYDLEGAGE